MEGAGSRRWVGYAWQLTRQTRVNTDHREGFVMIAYMVAVRRHVKDDKGASAVEYGLLIAAIAAVIVVIVFALGNVVKSKFQKTCTLVNNGGTATSCS